MTSATRRMSEVCNLVEADRMNIELLVSDATKGTFWWYRISRVS